MRIYESSVNMRIKIIGVSTFLFFVTVLASSHLEAPTIAVYTDLYYPLDEILYLEGRAKPNSTVQIQFQQAGLKPINLNTKSNSNGEWVLAEKIPLEAGNWEIRARIIESSGAVSSWSHPRIIKALVTGITVIGFTFKYAPTLVVFSLIFIASIILLMYSVFKVRIAQRLEEERQAYKKTEILEKAFREKDQQLAKEQLMAEKNEALREALREKERQVAELALEQSFLDLRKSFVEELTHLESKIAKGGGLTEEENEHRQGLLRKLREMEEVVEKKIKEIK